MPSDPDPPCSVCGRSVERALACVDADTGELLCPVHFRERHFRRVFAQRKLERWSPIGPGARKQRQQQQRSSTEPLSPNCAQLVGTEATRGVTPVKVEPAPSLPFESRHSPEAPEDSVQRLALRRSCARWRCHASRRRGTQALQMRRRRHQLTLYLACLRSYHSDATLCSLADAARIGRSFATLLSQSLWRTFCRNASEQHCATAACRRALSRWMRYAAWQRRQIDDLMTAIVRERMRSLNSALWRWAAGARLAILDRLEGSVACNLHRSVKQRHAPPRPPPPPQSACPMCTTCRLTVLIISRCERSQAVLPAPDDESTAGTCAVISPYDTRRTRDAEPQARTRPRYGAAGLCTCASGR
jgi:hypothetical protein